MECGVGVGLYPKGASVGLYGSVCFEYGKPYRVKHEFAEKWHFERFCRVCAPSQGVYDWKWQTHLSEERLDSYLEYLRKMKLGKIYRMQKGERLKRVRGVGVQSGETEKLKGSQKGNAAEVLVPVIRASEIDGKYRQWYGSHCTNCLRSQVAAAL